ncbi:hypothetical protein MIMGU_mgv1a024583mg [Erythranthe guttata]|uniref:Uncharacterized protein n=2 Tax=Erythranthe guttata TaxID=4155 RepID=A0A022RXD5_ERYGU|nr:hypothetical protein MIMGU_mgv1a024583mg [Erythranthe guttata]
MDIDADIAHWMLDYLLRQPLEEWKLSALIDALPLSNTDTNTRLERLILLKQLEYKAARFPVSRSTLVLFEQLEELDSRQGNMKVSDGMKHAYCAVAVNWTMEGAICQIEFFHAVTGLMERIEMMEKHVERNGALCSEELSEWIKDIKASMWNAHLFKSIMKKVEGLDVLDAVRVFVKGEREKMGPPLLELVKKLKDDEYVMEFLRGKAKIVDPDSGDENAMGPSYETSCKSPMSEEVRIVRRALHKSLLDLEAVVKDPLPEALKYSAEVMAKFMARTGGRNMAQEENMNQDTVKENAESMAGTSAREMPGKENHLELNQIDVVGDGNVQATTGIDKGNVRRPSLMERNKSARTSEWTEYEPEEEQGSRLPSPRTTKNAPNKPGKENGKDRRIRRLWTSAEEKAFETAVENLGVEKPGSIHWRAIATEYSDTIQDRTAEDLRYKWRNMTKAKAKRYG